MSEDKLIEALDLWSEKTNSFCFEFENLIINFGKKHGLSDDHYKLLIKSIYEIANELFPWKEPNDND